VPKTVDRETFLARMKAGRAKAKAARAVQPAPPHPAEPEPEPVTFICNAIPALGLALPSGLVSFDHGVLELTDPRDIAAVRRHYWFGSRIRERSENDAVGSEEGSAGTVASASEAVPASSPPAASSPHSPFRRFLRQAEGGGWRCGLCDVASPYFPTEGAALNHLFHQHRNVTTAPETDPAH
jgi:hypothetical protein